uniref:DNA-directed RNA polymerase subunit 5 n=1 Tax=Pithovirus LCPAC404 TaxID=2506597 RepID=A0A481ZC93_9VIRU|nr:MAG: DNA-directed RNA polymerase subunit 5 [Pithovirus LCPAC404]
MQTQLDAKLILYKVKYYQIRMMRNQNYDTDFEDGLTFFKSFGEDGMFAEFSKHYDNEMEERKLNSFYESINMSYRSKSPTADVEKRCYYIPKSNSKTGNVTVSQLENMLKINTHRKMIIIISETKIGSDSLRWMNTKAETGYRFLTFLFKELMFDIFENYLVPRHILLSRASRKKFLKDTGINIEQLSRIKEQDPAIKRLDGRPGAIVKIVRKSHSTDALVKRSIFYRLVVS